MKTYQDLELEVVFFLEEDVIRTSNSDNTEEMPEFPEFIG